MTGRDEEECKHRSLKLLILVEFTEGIDEKINALIPEFVASAGGHTYCFLRHLNIKKGISHPEVLLPGLLPFFEKLFLFRDKAVFKTVGGNQVHVFFKELAAFIGRDLTHGGEHIRFCR